MKKQKLAKLSLKKAKVANLKGGYWNQGPTINASVDTDCETASCLCGDPKDTETCATLDVANDPVCFSFIYCL